MQKISYCDLHCDTLTKCHNAGVNFFSGNLHASIKNLLLSGAKCQCFAIFTEGENAKQDFYRHLNFYLEQIKLQKSILASAQNYSQYLTAQNSGKLACVLTVENLGFVGNNLSLIDELKNYGVCMASLVWNNKNTLASPNLFFKNGVQNSKKRCPEGLSLLGKEAVELLDYNKIIIDISHLSDGGVEEILKYRKSPLVASHSNAFSVCGVSRNLTDEQIKKIADVGGVIGVNFYRKFLGYGKTFDLILRHINHIIKVGGEDSVAFGSDFDGIVAPQGLKNAAKMPNLLLYLRERMPVRMLEKLCHKNFERVFREIRS